MKKLVLNKAKARTHDHQAEPGLTGQVEAEPVPFTCPPPAQFKDLGSSPSSATQYLCVFASVRMPLVLKSTPAVCAPQAAVLQRDGLYDDGSKIRSTNP